MKYWFRYLLSALIALNLLSFPSLLCAQQHNAGAIPKTMDVVLRRGTLVVVIPTKDGLVICADKRSHSSDNQDFDNETKIRPLGKNAVFVITGTTKAYRSLFSSSGSQHFKNTSNGQTPTGVQNLQPPVSFPTPTPAPTVTGLRLPLEAPSIQTPTSTGNLQFPLNTSGVLGTSTPASILDLLNSNKLQYPVVTTEPKSLWPSSLQPTSGFPVLQGISDSSLQTLADFSKTLPPVLTGGGQSLSGFLGLDSRSSLSINRPLAPSSSISALMLGEQPTANFPTLLTSTKLIEGQEALGSLRIPGTAIPSQPLSLSSILGDKLTPDALSPQGLSTPLSSFPSGGASTFQPLTGSLGLSSITAPAKSQLLYGTPSFSLSTVAIPLVKSFDINSTVEDFYGRRDLADLEQYWPELEAEIRSSARNCGAPCRQAVAEGDGTLFQIVVLYRTCLQLC